EMWRQERQAVIRTIGWRRWSGLAAAVLMIVGVLAFLVPTERSATATVQSSLRALQQPGVDRRYEVRVMLPRQEVLEKEPMATVDVRDGTHLLVRARAPGGQVTMGRDEKGKWIIRPDGSL